MASLFTGVEKYVACQSRKSDFGWHRFRFQVVFHLAWCVRGLKRLKRFWPYLIVFSASRMVSLSNCFIWCLFFISNLMKSYFMGLFGFTFVKFETMIWPSIRFDYKLIELWKAFRKKTFQRIFSYDSGCKRKLWAVFLPRVHLWKKQTPGTRLKT